MPTRIIGDHPLARDASGKLRSRIGTVFPRSRTIVTLPGIHAMQRLAYLDLLVAERAAAGQPPLSRDEESAVWEASVDLVFEEGYVLIRPDPENMPLAFEADDVLQEIIPKHRIKFLNVRNEKVRKAVERQGECWRIALLPRSLPEMIHMIAASKVAIGNGEIYYYDRLTGTHFLTYQEFAHLESLDDAELRRQLIEIRDLSKKFNRLGTAEIRFFMADDAFGADEVCRHDFAGMDCLSLRSVYESLRQKFQWAVSPEFRRDDLESVQWRSRMYASLLGQDDECISEELLLGMSSEFFMQVQWLPGCRIADGELVFDAILDANGPDDGDPELDALRDEKCRGIIFNLVREHGDLEHINIGRIVDSLSRRAAFHGRRGVYVAAFKLRGTDREIVNIIRMQKWGVREHLDEGKSLLDAMLEADEYTEYVFDRRLGCRQLGMNLPPRFAARRVAEEYWGARTECHGAKIWSIYFQRDYIRGTASDKIPSCRLEDPAYALQLARLLGRAAAPNMIVGRCNLDGQVLFDDGDEVVIEGPDGIPAEIVVSDQTGTFVDYLREMEESAVEYARPIIRRRQSVADPGSFAAAYLDAFQDRFRAIQQEYEKRRRAFDTLFHHERRDECGSFAYRWERVLARLQRTDVRSLVALIEQRCLKAA
ncbi:MAG: hypothetical protein ACLP9L_27490 [Thermoguttaceae bacterium]